MAGVGGLSTGRRDRAPGKAGGTDAAPELAAVGLLLAGTEVVLMVEAGFSPLWVLLLFPATACSTSPRGTRRPSNAISALIVAGGFTWVAAGLANTSDEPLTAVGLVTATVPLAVIVHLLHAFPSGRVGGRAGRITVAVGYLVVFVLQMPIYLFGQGEAGPTTVLEISDDHLITHIGEYTQAAVGAAVMVATALILTRHLRGTEPARRRLLAPLFVYGAPAVLFVPISSFVRETWLRNWRSSSRSPN